MARTEYVTLFPVETVDAIVTPRRGLCSGCDYPLQDLPEPRCPECGLRFDPDRSTTMNMGRPLGELGRFVLGEASWPTVLVLSYPTFRLFRGSYRPERWYPDPLMFVFLYLVVVCVLVLMRHAYRAVVARWLGQPKRVPAWRERRLRWILCAVVLSVMSAAMVVPVRVGFLLGRAQFVQIAGTYVQDEKVPRRGQGLFLPSAGAMTAGPYRVTRIARLGDGGVMLFVDNSDGGFIYFPVGTPGSHYNSGCEGALGGGWWWFVED